jgi:histidyl-tRNA synthetase
MEIRMIFEHEIPEGSKIYFGEIAKLKRRVENIASELFYNNGFEEMITPIFSYHQIKSIPSQQLIHLTDSSNYPMNLRADSTIDVAKLMLKRIGRNSDNSKWFYIQPIYRYPSIEQYQIGAESIGSDNLSEMLKINIQFFQEIKFLPTLQISNIDIPRKISEELNIPIELFKNIEIKKILALNIDWLKELLYMERVEEIERVKSIAPEFIKEELEKIEELAKDLNYGEIKIAPLYYTKMDYYKNLYYKFLKDNRIYSRGGSYSIEDHSSVGFSIYSDEILRLFSKIGAKF